MKEHFLEMNCKMLVKLQLNQLLSDPYTSFTQLHVNTGIRLAVLSELANGKRQQI